MKTLIDIPAPLKRDLKGEAVERGYTFGDLVRLVLTQHAKKRKGRAALRATTAAVKNS